MVACRRRKLIEVSMPLEAINKASAREKSIRHGHPSTLHLWWARRPLAACRAVLFAQLVDDPSSWPEEFPTEADQTRERARLHGIIAEMVPWEATNDERILNKARCEIACSLARGLGEAPPPRGNPEAVLAWLGKHAPPVCDPFCGGGSIPLEAQRLGLRAHGSDLNPVAVLVSKATCEIPPRFAGRPPVNPEHDPHVAWKGAQGLAEDIRHYGKWMRDEAESRIGHLYPKAAVTEAMAAKRADLKPYVGKQLTVIAWLWARTVVSPDPMVRGAHVPLVRSFVLSSRKGKESIVVPQVDRYTGSYRFVVKAAGGEADELAKAKVGTSAGKRRAFRCLVSDAPIPYDHIRAEGKAGRMGERLMAIVVESKPGHGRIYLDPTEKIEAIAKDVVPSWKPDGELPKKHRNFQGPGYGLNNLGDLFTHRQLVALTTFSDLVAQAREKVLVDALAVSMDADAPRLADGGSGAEAYADAVSTYLAFALDKAADRGSSLCTWFTERDSTRNTLARQALPMTWDFAELNPLLRGTGSFLGACNWTAESIENSPHFPTHATITQRDAAEDYPYINDPFIATDPPYYDNISYADLSDFFYVWLRRSLSDIWPDLFRRVLAPKDEELVATPYRHGGKNSAEKFFMEGMAKALANMHRSGADELPVTIYYAFKQSEVAKEGLTSAGWATFLQGVADAGYLIDGTWPIRTELSNRTIGYSANALASSIVLVCRKRPTNAPVLTRRDFVARLRQVLPGALSNIRAGGIGPVDMAQAALGPGMGVFTAASRVLEPDDTPMTVRAAIALINRIRDEISGEEATGYDAETRFCVDWFEAFGMDGRDAGDAITMAQAYDIGIDSLSAAGVFQARGGAARLLRRNELPSDWDPANDSRLTDWECAQYLARVLESAAGGIGEAASLYARMGPERSGNARLLAYRLYDICERKGRAAEAQVWNMLAQEWPAIEAAAAAIEPQEAAEPLLL